MEGLEIYFGAMVVAIGSVIEFVKKKLKLSDVWSTVIAVVVCIAAALFGTMNLGEWNWMTFLYGSAFLVFGQMGWDFLIVKKIVSAFKK